MAIALSSSMTAEVAAMQNIDFQGNIIPAAWYHTIVNTKLKHPRPNYLAIQLLGDITYWYRPTADGRKKFNEDMLQMSYAQICEKLCCSSDQAKAALVFLEQLGAVKRVFRTLVIRGVQVPNVMYIKIFPDRIRELTSPDNVQSSSKNITQENECAYNISTDVASSADIGEKSTKTSAKILTYIRGNSHGYPCEFPQYTKNPSEATSDISQRKKEETIGSDTCACDSCHQSALFGCDADAVRATIHELIDYDYLVTHGVLPDSAPEAQRAEHLSAYQQVTNALIDIIVHPWHGRDSKGDCVQKLEHIAATDPSSMPDLVTTILDNYLRRKGSIDQAPIINTHNYLKQLCVNAIASFDVSAYTAPLPR